MSGLLCLALGFLGAVLPLLPTVPFLLLATFCFARSSPAWHRWLVTHPTFGPHIVLWNEKGAIPIKAKYLATGMMLAVLVLSIAMDVTTTIVVVQALVLALVALFIWSRPSS